MGGHIFRGRLDHCQKPPHGGRLNSKPGDHGTPNAQNRCYILFYHVWGPTCIEIHWNSILVEGPVTYDFTIYSRVRDHTMWFRKRLNLWTLSFGLFTNSWSRLLACAQSAHSRWEHKKLGLSQVLSPKSQGWHGYLHGNTFWRWGLEVVLRVGSSPKKARPNSLSTSLVNIRS